MKRNEVKLSMNRVRYFVMADSAKCSIGHHSMAVDIESFHQTKIICLPSILYYWASGFSIG